MMAINASSRSASVSHSRPGQRLGRSQKSEEQAAAEEQAASSHARRR
eukprot:CAMPEP_0170412364 /NCGR_PEP_ID=MMETSP0117_2-20130122/30929_1 /TAXON_ID=400756 /ORGANISM="Durinskia baltica, Strain CSIRO CS-38" /LENGTH=46 /DNA_ID= /DNA_START= /DNA_END= /DNA_ORIENTATION=